MDLAGDILYRFCHAPTTLLLSISPLRPAIKRVLRSSIFLVYNMNMKNKLETRKGIIDKIAHHFLKLGCISRRRDLRKKPQCSAITQALFPSPLAVLPRMYPILSPLLVQRNYEFSMMVELIACVQTMIWRWPIKLLSMFWRSGAD